MANGTIIKNEINYGTNISDSQPVGQVITSASDKTPSGYLPCDGRSLLRSDYPSLFAKIGTKYGAEDDEHFNLPNEEDMLINDQTTNEEQTWSSQKISDELDDKQDVLVSGTNIKTINGEDITGEGNIEIQGGGSVGLEITQVDYDNLSEEEKMNGTEYFITDGIPQDIEFINDNETSKNQTWSSDKLSREFNTGVLKTINSNAVRYSTSQSLTDAQKKQARDNIGVGEWSLLYSGTNPTSVTIPSTAKVLRAYLFGSAYPNYSLTQQDLILGVSNHKGMFVNWSFATSGTTQSFCGSCYFTFNDSNVITTFSNYSWQGYTFDRIELWVQN